MPEARLILPPQVEKDRLQEELAKQLEPRCPAAQFTHYKDTNRLALKCRVNDDHLVVQENLLAVSGFCCRDYEACPVWEAEKSGDPVVRREREARKAAKAKELTEKQIRSGLRVDDLGLDPEK